MLQRTQMESQKLSQRLDDLISQRLVVQEAIYSS